MIWNYSFQREKVLVLSKTFMPLALNKHGTTTSQTFNGSWVTRFHFLFRLSDFSQPVSFDHAEIGHCPNLAPPPPPAPLPDEEEPDKEGEELKPSQASTPAAVQPPAVSMTIGTLCKVEGMTCFLFKGAIWEKPSCCTTEKKCAGGNVRPRFQAWSIPVSVSCQPDSSKMILNNVACQIR